MPPRAAEVAIPARRRAFRVAASSSPGWADPIRIPVNPIRMPDPDNDDFSMM